MQHKINVKTTTLVILQLQRTEPTHCRRRKIAVKKQWSKTIFKGSILSPKMLCKWFLCCKWIENCTKPWPYEGKPQSLTFAFTMRLYLPFNNTTRDSVAIKENYWCQYHWYQMSCAIFSYAFHLTDCLAGHSDVENMVNWAWVTAIPRTLHKASRHCKGKSSRKS